MPQGMCAPHHACTLQNVKPHFLLPIQSSYASEGSKLISVAIDEDRGSNRAIITLGILFIIFAGMPLTLLAVRGTLGETRAPSAPEWPPANWAAIMYDRANSYADINANGRQQWPGDKYRYSDAYGHAGNERLPRYDGSASYSPSSSSSDEHHYQHDHHITDSEALFVHAQARSQTPVANSAPYWDIPQPSSRCAGYLMRDYTAHLQWNVLMPGYQPSSAQERERACEQTKVEIRGVTYDRPTRCEDKVSIFTNFLLNH